MKLPGKTLLPDSSSASLSNDGQMINEYITTQKTSEKETGNTGTAYSRCPYLYTQIQGPPK